VTKSEEVSKREVTITISSRFFEHLLACLANQKFIHDVNADGLEDGIDEVRRKQSEMQKTIDMAYRKGWELLMQQLPPEHKEDDPFALDKKLLGEEPGFWSNIGEAITRWSCIDCGFILGRNRCKGCGGRLCGVCADWPAPRLYSPGKGWCRTCRERRSYDI